MNPNINLVNISGELKHITQDLPSHPVLKDHPVLWDDEGDEWLFRRTTNTLIPKISDVVSMNDPEVRYTVCAIRRAPANGKGIDFVIWVEAKETNPETGQKTTANALCFGPSHAEDIETVESTITATMIAFEQVYKDPKWISQFEKKIIV